MHERIDDYGARLWTDWARAVIQTPGPKALWFWEASLFDEALPLLREWGKQLQREEIIAAFMRPTALWFWVM